MLLLRRFGGFPSLHMQGSLAKMDPFITYAEFTRKSGFVHK